MPPKRGRGRPRRNLNNSDDSKNELVLVLNDTSGETNSNEVEEHICGSCEKVFKTKVGLKRHKCLSSGDDSGLRIDDGHESEAEEGRKTRPQLQCTICAKLFVFKKSFERHMTNNHSNTPNSVSCDLCIVTCPNKQILQMHIEKKHSSKLYACKYCKKQFVRKAHVTRHVQQKGCDGRNLAKFSCGICQARFSRKDNLMVHLRLQHIAKSFFCKICQYSTRNFSKLILHTREKHYPRPLRYECDHCGKITKSRASITKHLETHGEKKYACGVCAYSTFTIEVMRRHTLTHVQDKPHKCHICDSSYIQRAQLVRHLEKHTGYTCDLCNKRFDSKESQEVHVLEAHAAKDLQKCTFEDCDVKDFKNVIDLRNHIKKDHLKTYECGICSKRFKSQVLMERHVSTHALERARRCMYCVRARAYVRGEHLLRHVRTSHADVFRQRLLHVRSVLGSNETSGRVRKSELEAILNVLDAESDRIIEDYGTGVLYGGLQEPNEDETYAEAPIKFEQTSLLSEEELAENLKELLAKLIDIELLEEFGWPNEDVDEILEKVVKNCGARAADRTKWNRVQRLRENAKHLFVYAIDDKNTAKMLDTHTIDQVVTHMLQNFKEDT